MAENEDNETSEAPDTPVLPGVVYYLIRSVIRGRSNRTARASQTGRRGFVQRFAGGTILVRRARPARVTEAVLRANLEEIRKACAEHRVEIATLQGQVVDLVTFEVQPLAVSKPLPNPPLDSAKNDKNQGIGYNVPPNPTGTPLDAPKPELLQKESLLPAASEPVAPGPTTATFTQAPPVDKPVLLEKPAAPEVTAPRQQRKDKGRRG